MIELSGISKIYGNRENYKNALSSINLSIEDGEMIAIMGPSGSGKSTLLNIIGGLATPSKGKYKYNDIDVTALNQRKLGVFRKEHISYVFQSYALFDKYTVYENVAFPLMVRGVKYSDRKEKVNKILDEFGLSKLSGEKPNKLSGGEQQRTAIARAVAANTDIILADEPTGALDQHNSELIMEYLKKVNEEGKTVIVVTHDKDVAEYADRIIYLKDGIIVSDK